MGKLRVVVPLLLSAAFLALAGWSVHLAATAGPGFVILAVLYGLAAVCFGAAATFSAGERQ